MKVRIVPLEKRHDRQAFDCGVKSLNDYLAGQARKEMERKAAAVFVAVEDGSDERVIGFYTLSAFSVALSELREPLQKRLPRYPQLPAVLIGRLARDRRSPGLGRVLLIDALERSFRQTDEMGAVAVIVDAKDDNAASFYQKFGFEILENSLRRLYLPMGTIGKLLGYEGDAVIVRFRSDKVREAS